jgi:hypothetical protein
MWETSGREPIGGHEQFRKLRSGDVNFTIFARLGLYSSTLVTGLLIIPGKISSNGVS